MRKWDYICAVLTIALGAAVIYMSRDFPETVSQAPGPGFYPTVLGWVLVLLGISLGVKAFIKSDGEEPRFNSKEAKVVYVLGGITTVYIVLVYFIGFLASTLLYLFVAMFYLGLKKKVRLLLISAVITIVIYIVFKELLNTPLPTPQILN